MSCGEVRELLNAFLDGETNAVETDAVRAHLTGCAECERERAELARTAALVRALPRVKAPAGFAASILARLDEPLAAPAPAPASSPTPTAAAPPPRAAIARPTAIARPGGFARTLRHIAIAAVAVVGCGIGVIVVMGPPDGRRDPLAVGFAPREKANGELARNDLGAAPHSIDAGAPGGDDSTYERDGKTGASGGEGALESTLDGIAARRTEEEQQRQQGQQAGGGGGGAPKNEAMRDRGAASTALRALTEGEEKLADETRDLGRPRGAERPATAPGEDRSAEQLERLKKQLQQPAKGASNGAGADADAKDKTKAPETRPLDAEGDGDFGGAPAEPPAPPAGDARPRRPASTAEPHDDPAPVPEPTLRPAPDPVAPPVTPAEPRPAPKPEPERKPAESTGGPAPRAEGNEPAPAQQPSTAPPVPTPTPDGAAAPGGKRGEESEPEPATPAPAPSPRGLVPPPARGGRADGPGGAAPTGPDEGERSGERSFGYGSGSAPGAAPAPASPGTGGGDGAFRRADAEAEKKADLERRRAGAVAPGDDNRSDPDRLGKAKARDDRRGRTANAKPDDPVGGDSGPARERDRANGDRAPEDGDDGARDADPDTTHESPLAKEKTERARKLGASAESITPAVGDEQDAPDELVAADAESVTLTVEADDADAAIRRIVADLARAEPPAIAGGVAPSAGEKPAAPREAQEKAKSDEDAPSAGAAERVVSIELTEAQYAALVERTAVSGYFYRIDRAKRGAWSDAPESASASASAKREDDKTKETAGRGVAPDANAATPPAETPPTVAPGPQPGAGAEAAPAPPAPSAAEPKKLPEASAAAPAGRRIRLTIVVRTTGSD